MFLLLSLVILLSLPLLFPIFITLSTVRNIWGPPRVPCVVSVVLNSSGLLLITLLTHHSIFTRAPVGRKARVLTVVSTPMIKSAWGCLKNMISEHWLPFWSGYEWSIYRQGHCPLHLIMFVHWLTLLIDKEPDQGYIFHRGSLIIFVIDVYSRKRY